jgi:hypothetical protein
MSFYLEVFMTYFVTCRIASILVGVHVLALVRVILSNY